MRLATKCEHTESEYRAHGLCNKCYQRQHKKKYWDENPEYRENQRKSQSIYRNIKRDDKRKYDMSNDAKRRYGLSREQAVEIRKQSCGICGKPGPSDIDHNHLTGKVRGPLCTRCNLALGWYEGVDKERLEAYLNE